MSRPDHRRLTSALTAWRIGDPRGAFAIWDGEGAARYPGRWNALGQRVIYAAEHYSLAMLEKLVHFSGVPPRGQHYTEATIPAGVSYEVLNPAMLPGWNAPDAGAARDFGARWYAECRSALLLVPSVVAPMERNILVHTGHDDFARVQPGLETPVYWDERLFA